MKRTRKRHLPAPPEGMIPILVTALLVLGIVISAGYGLQAIQAVAP